MTFNEYIQNIGICENELAYIANIDHRVARKILNTNLKIHDSTKCSIMKALSITPEDAIKNNLVVGCGVLTYIRKLKNISNASICKKLDMTKNGVYKIEHNICKKIRGNVFKIYKEELELSDYIIEYVSKYIETFENSHFVMKIASNNKVSVTTLARSNNVHANTMRKFINGGVKPGSYTLLKIYLSLGYDIDYIIENNLYSINSLLKHYRLKNDMSLEEVASRLKRKRVTITKYEQAGQKVSSMSLFILFELYNIPEDVRAILIKQNMI